MLCLVPTPIGNLEDISKRSLRVLEEAELIFCEDTRVTKKLLNLLSERYEIDFSNKEYRSFHSHNENQILKNLDIETFSKNVVYVSDAGMPCVSDPGAVLVDFCIKNQIAYDVLPGANAVLTAYAMSGFTHTTFSFYGFLDHKGASRASKLDEILNDDKSFYGHIPGFNGVYANTPTLEGCRKELEEVLEEWVFFRISQKLPLPTVDGMKLKIRKAA